MEAGPDLNDHWQGDLQPMYQAHLDSKNAVQLQPRLSHSAPEESPSDSPASGSWSTASAPVPGSSKKATGPDKRRRTSKYDVDRIPNFAGSPARTPSSEAVQQVTRRPASNRSSESYSATQFPDAAALLPMPLSSHSRDHISPMPDAQSVPTTAAAEKADESVSGAPPFETRPVEQ